MTEGQLERVRETWRMLAFRGEQLAERFFARLFEVDSHMRLMFPRDSWQRDRDLVAGMSVLVRNLHRLETVAYVMEDAGARCHRAGAQPQHFGLARDAMIDSMREMLAEKWSPELEGDWRETLNVATSVMIRGAGRGRARAA